MKATELMIGDYVYGLYPNGERYANPFCISAIDIYPLNGSPRIVTMGGYGFQQEHLAPIPLTEEILKKNDILFEVGPGGLYQCTIEGLNCKIEFSIIRYVHQLQHALKLCGIDKEIEL